MFPASHTVVQPGSARPHPVSGGKRHPERALPGRKRTFAPGRGGALARWWAKVHSSRTAHALPPCRPARRASCGHCTPCASPSWPTASLPLLWRLTMAVGSVLAKRLGNRKRRVAATLTLPTLMALLPRQSRQAVRTPQLHSHRIDYERPFEESKPMSLFSWFSRKPAPPRPNSQCGAEPSGLLNADATVPLALAARAAAAAARPARTCGQPQERAHGAP